MSADYGPSDLLTTPGAEHERLRGEVSALAAQSRVSGLFYPAGWLLVAVASQGFSRYPGGSAALAALFAALAGVGLLLRPAVGAPAPLLRRLGRLYWGLLLASAALWGVALGWVMLDPAFEATRPAAVVCSILLATAHAHAYPMNLPASLAGMALIYLPAPLLAGAAGGGLAVQLALALYALFLLITALHARREYLQQFDLQQRLRSQRAAARQPDQRDALTGLLDHASFEARLTRAGAQCRRAQDCSSLLLCDIDGFQALIERPGPALGDPLRVALARRLQQQLAGIGGAWIARWGGSAFAALLPGTTLAEAQRLAESLLQSLRQQPLLPGRPVITASAGVGQLGPGDEPGALLVRVQAALDQARQQGGDQVLLAAQDTTASHPRFRS